MSNFENDRDVQLKSKSNAESLENAENSAVGISQSPPPFSLPVQRKEDKKGDILSTMSDQFGTDLTGVNIHKNSSQATGLNAKAYTQGSDIHFAPGEYNPESQAGKQLIGHELTHVVQQNAGRVQANTSVNGQAVNNSPELEAEADQMGSKAALGSLLNTTGGDAGNSGGNAAQLKSNVAQRTEELDANIMGIQVRRTLRNVNSSEITPDTFSHLLQSILRVNGSSLDASIEIGLAAVREIGVWAISLGEVSAGVKILLGGQAEIKHDGKFSLKGSAGITGFVAGEISGLISGNVEAGATVELEGEWDSVAHFGAYVYQLIHTIARRSVQTIEAQGFGEYVPGSLRALGDAPDSTLGRRSPLVTSTATAHAGAGATLTLGGEEAGFSIGGATQVSAESFSKSRDGITTETGQTNRTNFTGSLTVGDYGLTVGVENSQTLTNDHATSESTSKTEEKWTLELSGSISSLEESDISALSQLPMGMNITSSVADAALSLGRRIASRVTDIQAGPASINRTAGSSASLIFEVKFEIDPDGRHLKEITIARKASVTQSTALQVPATGVVDLRGSAAFSGSLTRTIFHASF